MSVPLTVNGVTFQYPQEFDTHWGPTLTNWSTAVTNALKPLTGGYLTLPYPTSGVLFQNSTLTGYLGLTVNGSNQLTFNGTPIGATVSLTDSHILVGNVLNQPADVAMSGDITISNTGVTTLGALKVSDSQIATLAGITLSKLASTTPYYWYAANSTGVLSPLGVTASRAVISDANGLPSASVTTSTELSYLSGVTSSIQSQFSGLSGSFLPLAGGTMSGNIAMGSNKITGVTQGSNAGEVVVFPVTGSQLSNNTITATQIANNTVTASQIANNTITASQIANNTITASQIANNTITATQIANATITSTQIANSTILIANLASEVLNYMAQSTQAPLITDTFITGIATGGNATATVFSQLSGPGNISALQLKVTQTAGAITVTHVRIVVDGTTIIDDTTSLTLATWYTYGFDLKPSSGQITTETPKITWKTSCSIFVDIHNSGGTGSANVSRDIVYAI